jgi:hypothetical protein
MSRIGWGYENGVAGVGGSKNMKHLRATHF